MKNKMMRAALVATALSGSAMAQTPPPTGPDIGAGAAACRIGPYPQVSKAGPYNGLCETLQDGEKCLALIKSHINRDGTIEAVMQNSNEHLKAQYCLDLFKKDLLGE